jgi:hypothetical protein
MTNPNILKAHKALERAGGRITLVTGTMYVAIGFALLAFISLPAVIASGDPIVIVAWITQSFLQLVLLPIIIVGQNAQGAKTEARDVETHDAVMAEHAETREILADLREMMKARA